MNFRFYSTMARSEVDFSPREEGKVRIYSCGPTVYNYAHIGNFRSYIFSDLLRRSLLLAGYHVEHALNITDVDDKTIRGTLEESDGGLDNLRNYTQRYQDAFFEDLDSLGIERFDHHPRATESIGAMVDLVERIENNGYAYRQDGSVYFSIEKKKDYGKLSHIDLSGVKAGARYNADEYEKDDVRDFVLWKAEKPEEKMAWDTPIGRGRPGWHLECSAMIHSIFQGPIDIHTGGVDLIFPHHENEIAQSEAGYGEDFVGTWLHCEHLLVDGQKMSKSKGNFYTLRDLLNEGFSPAAIRYLLLSVHYRAKMNFTREGIGQSEAAVERYLKVVERIENSVIDENLSPVLTEKTAEIKEEFLSELKQDLNMPRALAVVHSAIRMVNQQLDETSDKLSSADREALDELFHYFDRVLNLKRYAVKEENDPQLVQWMNEREEARRAKDFKKADEMRDAIAERGYKVLDTPQGPKLEKI